MIANTNSYSGNDHIALQADLELLDKLGFRILSSAQLIKLIKNKVSYSGFKRACCITFDDAPIFDYCDFSRPHSRLILSFKSILLNSPIFRKSRVPVTSFAIASEEARRELDITCMKGNGEWGSDWWQEAIAQGIFEIANHSFDHMHDTLKQTHHSRGEKGNFYAVDNYEDADRQIRQAQDELDRLTGNRARALFAYPYGHVNDYLVREYFPDFQHEHRQEAAFSTAGDFAHKDSNIWNIPRFVCGDHWKSTDELEILLSGAN